MAGRQHILYKLTQYLRKKVTLYYSNRSPRTGQHGTDDLRSPSYRELSPLDFCYKSSLPSQVECRCSILLDTLHDDWSKVMLLVSLATEIDL